MLRGKDRRDTVDDELDGQRSEDDAEHPGAHGAPGDAQDLRDAVGPEEGEQAGEHDEADDGEEPDE